MGGGQNKKKEELWGGGLGGGKNLPVTKYKRMSLNQPESVLVVFKLGAAGQLQVSTNADLLVLLHTNQCIKNSNHSNQIPVA